ncbi:MAG: hypothetical protein R2834_00790 [Rhodothermales bacterium]
MGLAGCRSAEPTARQAVVAERGSMVMPFDLDRTTHHFEKLPDGGRQQVVTDDGDAGQIALIQSHLAEEAERFSRGDFHDPAMIHGDHMAGMHELVMGHDRIEIAYTPLPDGGQILYTTDDPALVEAIHAWFDAQVSDHGHHAQDH